MNLSASLDRPEPESPDCGSADAGNEGDSNQAPRYSAFAPALEHGDKSNEEENDASDSEDLEPHGIFLNAV